MKKTKQLKNLINSKKLEFLMEAHNGLSAKIVEETGFKGIWGSGLSLSAAMGVRDNNEASWTQILETLEFMSDITSIPILLDGDTGYGNFNNMRRLIRKLEQRDIAGVCIEDKLFPKTNSFISGESQLLADMDEFCGKIKAAKDTQKDSDFVVAARIEAFIAGWGLGEALRRADAYCKAGADAILVHSKKSDHSDIDAFMKEWSNRLPVIIVPTKYYSVPTDVFKKLGVSVAIWANHNLRAAAHAMQAVSKQIFQDESLINIQNRIVSVEEVFRLQGADELKEAEKKYLPASGKNVNAVILAATQGDLGELTKEIPKTLLKVGGKSILSIQIDKFNKVGIKNISVVRGFQKDKIRAANVTMIDNDDYDKTGELCSLNLVKDAISENTVISYGDILFKSYILNDLLNDKSDITIMADADFEYDKNDVRDYITADVKYSKTLYGRPVTFMTMASNLKKNAIAGEFIGLWKVNSKGALVVKQTLKKLSKKSGFNKMTLADLFNEIAKTQSIAVKYIMGSWLDIDTIVDLQKAGDFYA